MRALVFSLFLSACAERLADTARADLVEPLATPCGEFPVSALLAESDGRAWVGCSHGRGVFRTTDAGISFEPMHASARLVVNQLAADAGGRALLCGHDLASPGRDAVLLRYHPSRGWHTLRSSPRGQATSCERVAAAPDGALALLESQGAGVRLHAAAGRGWLEPSAWYAGTDPEPRLWDLATAGGCWYALGADLTGPPRFLLPAGSERCLPLRDVVVDHHLVGELWTLASPDGGGSWLAGGRDLGEEPFGRAVLYRSPDGGESWREQRLPPGLGWVRQLGFSPSGHCGVAVGQRAGLDAGGFVLVSHDGGTHWWELDLELPALRAVSVFEQGFLVGGEGGFLGAGRCG
jgi:photosystem II stability/assembly factor-like uncharacterized protein